MPAPTQYALAFGGVSLAAADRNLYEKTSRTHGWEWPEQKRVGAAPVLQFTGKAASTFSVSCAIFPTGPADPALGIPDTLRRLADAGAPDELCFGRENQGFPLGPHVLKSVGEERAFYRADGTPRQITLTLTFSSYGDNGTN